MENNELKRCPFCGGKAKLKPSLNEIDKVYVQCIDCGIRTIAYPNINDPITDWNRRVENDKYNS